MEWRPWRGETCAVMCSRRGFQELCTVWLMKRPTATSRLFSMGCSINNLKLEVVTALNLHAKSSFVPLWQDSAVSLFFYAALVLQGGKVSRVVAEEAVRVM